MSTYNFGNLKIEVDNSGGSLVDISQYVTEINDVNTKALVEEGQTAGDTWMETLDTGLRQMEPVVLKGFYDDSASGGPNVLFSSIGNTRTLKVTWGGSKTTQVEAVIEQYKRRALQKQLHKYETTLIPTGTVAEA